MISMPKVFAKLGCGAVLALAFPAVASMDAVHPFRDALGDWKVLPCWGGGYVLGVKMAPSNPDVWYANVDVGAPYRSVDGGKTWRALHQAFTVTQRSHRADQVRSLDIDPRNPDSFVIASGNARGYPAGMFVSRNGGRTFRQTGLARFHGQGEIRNYGNVIARNPFNADELVAGEDMDGLFVSRDNGESWQGAETPLDAYWFTDIRYDPDVKGRVYACAPAFSDKEKGGFFRSDDGGVTWQKLSDASPTETVQLRGGRKIVGAFPKDGLKSSDDGGVTWTDDGLNGDFRLLGAGKDVWIAGTIEGDMYRRGRRDSSWTKLPMTNFKLDDPVHEPWFVTKDKWTRDRFGHGHHMDHLSCVDVDPRDDSHWVATDWLGVYETHDGGQTWVSRMKGMSQIVPFTVSCDPFDEKNLVYGAADVGLYSSQDGGQTFSLPNFGYWCTSVAYSHVVRGLALSTGGKQDITFAISRNSGRSWELLSMDKGLPKLHAGSHGVYSVVAHPRKDEFFIAVSGPVGRMSGGIYMTRDQGKSWEWFGDGLPEGEDLFRPCEFTEGWKANELVISPDGSMLARAVRRRQLYWYDRNAKCWRLSSGSDGRRTAAADPFRPGRFLICSLGGLLESTDAGATFRPMKSAPGEWCCVAFDPFTKDLLMASDPDHIFISRNGGRTFSVFSDSYRAFPSGHAKDFDLDRGRVFFRSDGSGVYYREVNLLK